MKSDGKAGLSISAIDGVATRRRAVRFSIPPGQKPHVCGCNIDDVSPITIYGQTYVYPYTYPAVIARYSAERLNGESTRVDNDNNHARHRSLVPAAFNGCVVDERALLGECTCRESVRLVTKYLNVSRANAKSILRGNCDI